MYTSKNRNPKQLYEFDIWATGEHRASHRGTTGPPEATGGHRGLGQKLQPTDSFFVEWSARGHRSE